MMQIVLTDPEQDLVSHSERGAVLDLLHRGPRSPGARPTYDPSQVVRADVIRRLLLGRLGAPLDPHGVRIRGARIVGPLDLENVESRIQLSIADCLFENGVVLRDASLGSVSIQDSVVESTRDTHTLDARGLAVSTLLLAGTTVRAVGEGCPLVLISARVTNRLDLSGVRLEGHDADGVSLFGDGLVVGGGLHAGVRDDRPFVSGGAVRLLGGAITGQFDLSGAHLAGHDGDGDSLLADRLRVDGDAVLAAPADGARRFRTSGAVSIPGAHVTGELNLSGAELGRNAKGVSLRADNITVDSGARLTSLAEHRFIAQGAINLSGASITGLLDLTSAEIRRYDDRGVSLIGDRLTVTGTALLRADQQHPFSAAGQVRLLGAHISRVLDMAGASLAGGDASTPSLWADRITVDGDMDLGRRDGLAATSGHGISLRAAKIAGRLTGSLANIGTGGSESALGLRNATLGEFLVDPRLAGSTDLTIDLDGATYQGVPAGETDSWLGLLRHHTKGYTPQPYQQLAAANRAVGNKREAIRTSIAQQEDRRTRHLRPTSEAGAWTRIRLFTRRRGLVVQKVVIGYGYRTWPAFAGVLLLALLGAGLGLSAGHTIAHPATHPTAYRKAAATDRSPTGCSTVEQVAVGVHVPFLNDIASGDCTLDTTTTAGELYSIAVWTTDALMWAVASLAVAGYTGLVRQS
ncbi:MAG TPA: hypothetical protein VGN18_00815 [Jatrophihabitans sp.]|jgi:hypothetical protein|uniref:hypothetical protein n=1 Tax=Jatrophihabitans sp. TaxID=1932789 RepID=UPI002E0B25F5|nr:hypothetical protein [Jatrophihabitans sp.]